MNGMQPTEHRGGDGDEIRERLDALARDVEQHVGPAGVVEREDGTWVSWSVEPRNPRALGAIWHDFGDGLQLETISGIGGVWELQRNRDEVQFIEDAVWAIVAGRVDEVVASNRSHITITLADGSRVRARGHSTLAGCLPLPGWRHWGRHIRYEPYR